MHTLPGRPWTALQKIAFRFFFPFLSLQLLTENFLGNLFGYSLEIWTLGEKIFVRPCLWLNKHFFHFKYAPESWTTFSGGLHTIRDTVYLGASCLICVGWTIFDKRPHYTKLHYWFSQCLVTGLSAILFAYGVIKLFPVQMRTPSFLDLQKPVGSLSPFELIWTTFGYGKPYQVFSGVFELSGALLLLYQRTRVVALLIILPVLLNVILLNYTYQIGVLPLSFYLLLMVLFLLAPYARPLFFFLFTGRPAALSQPYLPGNNLPTKLFRVAAFLFVGTSITLNTIASYSRFTRNVKAQASTQISLVRHFVAGNDTLPLIENDTVRWKIWSERVINGKRSLTIAAMNPGTSFTYAIERDSSHHQLILHPTNQPDTGALHFAYTEFDPSHWRLEGNFHQMPIKADLQRINPDTMSNLLKTKRITVITDDE